jgi:predicted aspartyl protease
MTSILLTFHRLSALAAACLFSCVVLAVAPDPSAVEEVQGARDLEARLTVPVTINGGGPYHFVVDTGSERTVISRELAERLTLAPARPVTLLSIAGIKEVQTAMVAELRLTPGRSPLSDLEAPILSELHLGAAGILGIDSLQAKKVILDFRKMRMSISDATSAGHVASGEIVVTARRRLGQLILVDADVEGQKISVIIDTGAAVSLGNPKLRERLSRRGSLGTFTPINITSVTGLQTAAEYTTARHLRIGGVTMNDMPIAFANPSIFHRLGLDDKPALLLGMDALQAFDRVSIDFANSNVRFLMPGDSQTTTLPQLAGRIGTRAG